MERKHIPESENRLVILFALSLLGGCTATQLLQLMVEKDLMNYFTLQLSLSDMEQQGQLVSRPHPLGSLLEMTDSGRYTLESFAHRIPLSRRTLIEKDAPLWRERFRLEQQTPADSFPLQDGSQCLRLRLLEGGSSLMELLLTLPCEEHFTFLQRRWCAAAQAIYHAVNLTLAQGFDPALPPQPCCHADVQQLAGHEWLLSLSDKPDKPSLTLLLTLADENLACHYAARWPLACEELHRMILRELRRSLPAAHP